MFRSTLSLLVLTTLSIACDDKPESCILFNDLENGVCLETVDHMEAITVVSHARWTQEEEGYTLEGPGEYNTMAHHIDGASNILVDDRAGVIHCVGSGNHGDLVWTGNGEDGWITIIPKDDGNIHERFCIISN